MAIFKGESQVSFLVLLNEAFKAKRKTILVTPIAIALVLKSCQLIDGGRGGAEDFLPVMKFSMDVKKYSAGQVMQLF